MGLPAKYQHLIGKGLKVKEEGAKLVLSFLDPDLLHDFLLLYEQDDFSGLDLQVNSLGSCQKGCGQEFMGGLAKEMLSLAAAQAREVQSLGGELLVHVCPCCQLDEAGGLQRLIDQTKAAKKRLRIVD